MSSEWVPVVPSPRNHQFSANVNWSTFYWGGATWDGDRMKKVPVSDLGFMYTFDLETDKWDEYLLKGKHPPGVCKGACAVVGNSLYLYGGEDSEGNLTGSLFELSLSTKSWTELPCQEYSGPKRKRSCGMVNYFSTLIVYGGWTNNGDTNELHLFDIKAGMWNT